MLADPQSPVAGWDTLRLNMYSNPGFNILGLTTRSVELCPVEVVTSSRIKTSPVVSSAVQLYWGLGIKRRRKKLSSPSFIHIVKKKEKCNYCMQT